MSAESRDLSSRSESVSCIPKQKIEKAEIPHELREKRSQLFFQIETLVSVLKELKKIEDEEWELSEKYKFSSVQSASETSTSDYVDCAFPSLGSISTYSGPMPSVWGSMPRKVAEVFSYMDTD